MKALGSKALILALASGFYSSVALADPGSMPLLGNSGLKLYTQKAYEAFDPATDAAVDARYDELIDAGMDTARHLFDWRDLEPTPGHYDTQFVTEAMDELAERGIVYQFANLVVLDSAGPVVPDYVEGLLASGAQWEDPRIIGSFSDLLDVFVPIMLERGMFMLGLSNEPGGYYEDEPVLAASFKGFIAAAVDRAHALEPNLATTVVFAGPNDPAIPDLMPLSDVAVFNYYFYRLEADPDCRLDGQPLELYRSDIAENVATYLDELIAAADGRLVNIQEIGQASAGDSIGPQTSEAHQAAVYEAMILALSARRDQIRSVCNWTLNDHRDAWFPLAASLIDEGLPACFADNVVDIFTATGLVRSDATASRKPAFEVFKNAIAPLADVAVDPEEQFLKALFASFNGETWADRAGWLEPGLHWCDWYGVRCSNGFEPPRLESVRLSENGLTGEFSEALVAFFEADQDLPVFELDLSKNEISGSISLLPSMINFIDLSGNQLSGPLPDILPLEDPDEPSSGTLSRLDLSDNLFSGTIPSTWPASVSLLFLDLSTNRLEGSLEAAVRSMADLTQFGTENNGLWVSDNEFSGTLQPEWFVDVELDIINLCRTKIVIEDPALDQWIAERHWGGNQNMCLDREQFALDPTISGSWYNPSRPGEGFSVMLLDSGVPLVYWFSHISFNRQFWLFNTGSSFESHVFLESALRTRGRFGSGFSDAQAPLAQGGEIRLDRIESNRLHVELGIDYRYIDVVPPGSVIVTPFPIPAVGFRSDHLQLSRLAGTTCENQRQTQWMSGAWFDPERSGEGFVVEVIEDGRGVVYWFTYTHADEDREPYQSGGARPDDWQAWMTGDGQIVGNTLTIDPLLRPVDTEGMMPFAIEGVVNQPVGRLEIHFDDDLNGHIDFVTSSPDFPSLSHPIERLARPKVAECD